MSSSSSASRTAELGRPQVAWRKGLTILLCAFIAVKLALLVVLTWNTKYVMDEYWLVGRVWLPSIGGVGITCAMQDAVVAANVLAEPLRAGRVGVAELARVQRQRDPCTRVMQFLQHVVERQYVKRVFDSGKGFRTPRLFRLPGMNYLTAYITAYGVWPVRLNRAELLRSSATPVGE